MLKEKRSNAKQAPRTILVVEDNLTELTSTTLLLEREGYKVLQAMTGEEALACAQASNPDLILLDHHLPGLDGPAVVERMRADPALHHLFTVIYSASCTSPEERAKSLRAGADGYLNKPLAGLELLARVDTFLRQKELMDSQRRQQEQFRQIIMSGPDAILVVSNSGDILFCNSAAERLFHQPASELVTQRYDLPPSVLRTSETQIELPNGTVATAEVRATSIEWEECPAHLVTLRDISESKRADETLRDTLQTADDLVRFMPAGIMIYEYEVPDRLALLQGNAEAELLIGLSMDEWRGRDLDEVWPAARERGLMDAFLAVMRTGQPFYAEDVQYRDHRLETALRVHAFRLPGARLAVTFEDITLRKRTEKELRDSEALYYSLVESIPQCLFRKDLAGRITFANRHFSEFLSRPLSELVGRSDPELFPPGLAERFRHDDQQVLALGQILTTSATFHRPGAGEQTLQIVKAPLTNAAGEVIGIQGIFWDVTEQRRSEERVRASEEQFRTLVESAPDAIFVQTAGRFAYVNGAAVRLFGADSADQLLEWPVRALLHPASRDGVEARFRALLERGEQLPRTEEKYVTLSGSVIDVEVSAVPFRYENRSGALVFVRETTERKRSEDALRRSERELSNTKAMLEAAFRQTPLPMVLATCPDGIIRIVNSACLEFLGIVEEPGLVGTPIDVTSRSWGDIEAHGREIPREQLPLARALRGLTTRNRELGVRRRDGALRWELVTASPIYNPEGEMIAVFAVFPDITDRKQIEQQLRDALEQKDVLLREVHHRVKNNLQAIIHLIEAREERLASTGDRTFMRELGGQARTMSLVYEQLYQTVNVARIEMQPYLEELTENVLQAFGRGRALGVEVEASEVTMDVETAMPCGLVVNELLTNALKHAFPAPLTQPGHIQVTLQRAGGEFHLEVRDDGVGLPRDFSWGEANSLGLKLVRLWVTHQLGGAIELADPPGTTFTIRFATRETGVNAHA